MMDARILHFFGGKGGAGKTTLASAFALNIFIIHAMGDVISPPLIGWISDKTGGNMNAGFGAVSLAIFLSGVFWLLGSKHLARDTARVDSSG